MHGVITEALSASHDHPAKGFKAKTGRDEGQSAFSNGNTGSIASRKEAKRLFWIKIKPEGEKNCKLLTLCFFLKHSARLTLKDDSAS